MNLTKKRLAYEEILDRLLTGKKTAKEIAEELYYLNITKNTDRNIIAVKLNKLEKEKLIKVVEIRGNSDHKKTVRVYEILPKGIEERFNNHIPTIY